MSTLFVEYAYQTCDLPHPGPPKSVMGILVHDLHLLRMGTGNGQQKLMHCALGDNEIGRCIRPLPGPAKLLFKCLVLLSHKTVIAYAAAAAR